jgi:hypothetical protein
MNAEKGRKGEAPYSKRVGVLFAGADQDAPDQRVLSENHIRAYWWCSPDKIGMATMTPDRWTARPRGASLPNAKCVRLCRECGPLSGSRDVYFDITS